MTKPKLSDAIKPANASTAPASAAATTAPAGSHSDQPPRPTGDKGSDDDSDDDDEPDASASGSNTGDGPAPAAPAAAATAPAAEKTLADFRSAFGHETGSVFFADGTSFVDACVAHMDTQAKIIAAQAEQLATLQGHAEDLAATAHGREEPLSLHGDADDNIASHDGVGTFAAGLTYKGNKAKA